MTGPTWTVLSQRRTPGHVTTSYPFGRTVGCSCGWTRTNVHADIHDDLIEAHLKSVGAA